MTATHLIIHGKVQGVFYRDWTVETARSLGLAGWVRNLADGTVEAHLEGDAQSVKRMIAAMHDGPPRAAPTRIDGREVEPLVCAPSSAPNPERSTCFVCCN